MQKKDLLIFVTVLVCFAATSAFGFGGGSSMPAAESAPPVVTEKINALTIQVRQEGTDEILEIPLFSEKYAQLPVATVDEEPITLRKFALELATMHGNMTESGTRGSQNLTRMLDRLITVKLVKQEALNIGFDRTPAVQKQIENFALETMIKQLLAEQLSDIRVETTEVDELYQQMAIEVKLSAYKVFDQADAEALLEDSRATGDFKQLADKLVAEAKAEGGETSEYVRLNELLPAVAKEAYALQAGDISQIFKEENDFMLFKLDDKRVYEDADVRQAAANQVFQQQAKIAQQEYLQSLEDKYATFDSEAEEALNFAKIAEENPQAKGSEILARLSEDQRPVVTMTSDSETVVFTVAEIAKQLESSLFHGADKVIDPVKLDQSKESIIYNKIVAVTGRMEAQAQGIDKTAAYLEKLQAFEDQVLFDIFIAKAVVPGIKVPEDDAKAYYYNHLEEYASPLMLKMKSLPFSDAEAAQEALKKLQAGSDFKWVSSNTTGLADAENKDILNLGETILSVNALPHDLQHKVTGARQGDTFYYAGPNNLSYVLLIEAAFPPKAKPYEEVRQEVGQIIYGQKINAALEEWVSKLKEVYETKVFIVENKS